MLTSARLAARPGLSPRALEHVVRRALADADVRAANPEVLGYPHAICFGLNSVIAGLRDLDAPLAAADLVTLDVAARGPGGALVDAALSFSVGPGSENVLCVLAEKATRAGIDAIAPGASVADLLAAIRAVLPAGGPVLAPLPFLHGIGPRLHEEPYATPDDPGVARFRPGMVLAVEPVLMDRPGRLSWDVSGWEISAANGCATAFVEHTVVVTETGARIVTEWAGNG